MPLPIVRERTTALAIVASLAVGMAMFGGAVFLGQYFQIGRGYSPTQAGLLTIPLMAGVLIASVVTGRVISRTGRIKPYVVVGTVVLVAGFGLLSFLRHDTPLWFVGLGMFAVGIGVGMSMQNLVLAVQNTVPLRDIGAASASVAFFRSLGGAIGVSVLGAVLAHQVAGSITRQLAAAGAPASGGIRQPRRGRAAGGDAADRADRVRGRDRAHLPDLGGHRGGRRSRGRAAATQAAAHQPRPGRPAGAGRGRRRGPAEAITVGGPGRVLAAEPAR